MARRANPIASVTLAVLLVLSTAATAFAAPSALGPDRVAARRAALKRARAVGVAGVGASAVTPTPRSATTAQDAWDSADDTYTAATSLPTLPVFDGTYLAQTHTFYKAQGTAETGGDVDWFTFAVDQDDLDDANTYLFEAVTASTPVDPIVELYKADGSGHIRPTPASDLPDALESVTGVAGGCFGANDFGFWGMANNNASLSFSPNTTGTYYVRVRPYYASTVGFNDGAGPYEFRAKVGQLSRIAGANRYEVAVNVSREWFPNNYAEFAESVFETPTVIVANGTTFSDALPAAALSFAADGPLLLVPGSGTLPSSVSSEIRRVGATRVIVVGGTGSVSAAMASSLDAIPGVTKVERVSGANRYSNAVAIAKRADTVNINYAASPFAFIVNGDKYPDALSASPMSAYNIAPILFTRADTLDSTTANYLTTGGITDVCIVGGTGSVSTAVENKLKSQLGSTHVRRISGADRYEASKNFAAWATELTVAPGSRDDYVGTTGEPTALGRLFYSRTGFASGEVFADALAGGAFAGYVGAPVILTGKSAVSRYIWENGTPLPDPKTDWYFDVTHGGEDPSINPSEIQRSYLFGGTGTVTELTASTLDRLTGPGPDAVIP